jgi:cyanophycinase
VSRLIWTLGILLSLAGGASAQQAQPDLVRHFVGDPKDAEVQPCGPALLLMGGGRDVDAAFRWWRPYMAGGDVVVLRTSGGAGYNDYLLNTIGGCDSVETLLVTSRALANDARVAKSLAGAEAIFLAGGDQATYLANWRGTAVEKGLRAAWKRKAAIGGTSAGLAVLGQFVFSARKGTIRSGQALADPHHERLTLSGPLLGAPLLARVITDSHFSQRKRLGRLVTFLARLRSEAKHSSPIGLGIDERTALVVGPEGRAAVLGSGRVALVRLSRPGTCEPGQALDGTRVEVTWLSAGHTLVLPKGTSSLPVLRYRVRRGVLERE